MYPFILLYIKFYENNGVLLLISGCLDEVFTVKFHSLLRKLFLLLMDRVY